jgi:transposase
MTKEFLEGCLAEGLSLDQIAARTGRHPSTVSYHLRKHGLLPLGHDVHGPTGKVDPDHLRQLISEGESIHGAAEKLGVSYTTARYWVRKLGLETRRMIRLRESRAASVNGETRGWMTCATHGPTWFFKHPTGATRCAKCRSAAVARRRRRVKEILIERFGGACQICGYDTHPRALQFHHLDPASKSFSISRRGVTRAFAEVAAEAEKCVLLCANCHAEVEEGVTEIPSKLLPLKLRAVDHPG